MADPDPRLRAVLDWLREHKLIQVLAIYAAASWAILEVTDVFIDKLGLPAWFFPAAIVLLLIGLAVVTATAIVEHGAPTGAGEQRARPLSGELLSGRLPSLTWPRAILGGVLAFSALALLGFLWTTLRDGGEPGPVAGVPENAVAVLPFRTTGAGLDVWREGLMDVLSANIDGVGDLRAIDTRTVLNRWRSRVGDAEAPADVAMQVARELGARWALHGQAVELGGRVRLDARFYAAETGRAVATASVVGPPEGILGLMEGVTLELLRGLGREQGLGDRGRAFTSTSLEAVKAYAEGEQAMRRSDWNAAIESFERALRTDSTFAMAAARLSEAYGWRYAAGHPAAVAAAEHALRFADRLPARQRALLELTHHLESGRGVEAIELARRLVSRYPSDPEIWYNLGEAYYHLGEAADVPTRELAGPFERAVAMDSTFLPALIHLQELTARDDDLEGFDRTTRLLLAVDSTSDEMRRRRLAHALVRGSAGDSLSALEELERLPFTGLNEIMLTLLNPRWAALDQRIAREMAAPRHTIEERSRGLYFWLNVIEIWRGRPSAAEAALEAAERLSANQEAVALHQLAHAAHGFGDTTYAERAIARGRQVRLFDVPVGRWLLGYYHLGNDAIGRAESHADSLALLADSLDAAGDTLAARSARGLADGLRGLAAGRRGDHATAVATLRRSIPRSLTLASGNWIAVADQRLGLAGSLAELGQEAEALTVLESGFEPSAYTDVPAALFRARLYEDRGEREKAIRAYSRVVELWRDCDPELLPQRQLAERALERLVARG